MSARSLALVRLLPRKGVSRVLGLLSELRLPSFLLVPVLRAYSKGFGVDLSEAERPLSAYASFNDFFTRALRPGLRPSDADPRAIVSPIDGRVYASGSVGFDGVFRVKGAPYSLAELLGSEADAAFFPGGTFLTAYLSPKDYHRIHWPFDGTVTHARHLPGDLWPVNDGAVAGVPGLFARNERVAILGTMSDGRPFALVPVGALNVGSIRLAFHRLRTNRGGSAIPRALDLGPTPIRAIRGAEAARFAFGSAIVLLVGPPPFTTASRATAASETSADRGPAPRRGLDPLPVGTTLRLGVRIGT